MSIKDLTDRLSQFFGLGYWRVIYRDGTWTWPQTYDQAVALIELYGGTLERAASRFERRPIAKSGEEGR